MGTDAMIGELVYVVTRGVCGRPRGVVDVFAHRREARAAALRMPGYLSGDWAPESKNKDEEVWADGDGRVAVEKWRVR